MACSNFGTHFIKTKFHVNSSHTQILTVSLGHFPGSPVSVQSINYHVPRSSYRVLAALPFASALSLGNISCVIF